MQHALLDQADGALCVAYSGGPDSTALLHALAQLPEARARGLRALHVDHGLHAESAQWAAHCQSVCHELGVDCDVLRVEVDIDSGLGIEGAARHARYTALAAQLGDGERLLLGHHGDDQVETVLLKLLRGAGPEGLGGMRACRPLGRGLLWRPLLALSREQLRGYIDAHALLCIEDPSNTDTRLARNYLRNDILPRLARHWPQATASIQHSARLSRDAADALQTQWLAALETLRDPLTDSLDATGWIALPPGLREPLLDHWLHARGRPAPTAQQRVQIERQLHARAGRMPCICWTGTELHIWKGRLWAHPPQPALDPEWESPWSGQPLPLPDGSLLTLTGTVAALPEPLTVRWRRGGEKIKPAGDAHTRKLRDLFQQAAIPPWQRMAYPLIYAGDELIAVANRWLTERGETLFGVAGGRPHWSPANNPATADNRD
ncbi:tRNA lysidine(34) synthetase TilS [Dyella tabacisoli]|uniref:tRNA(Ile)-lysidine synthase n=1 Tax=Dyella tabacisoli TaxID=2282381 RepID=A0A369UNF6_9GAMM|nr:tRNA lysidine(34) synthetase TilS [Dyella tabacisoli]